MHPLHLSNNINYSTHPQNLIYSKIENFIDKFHINEKHNLVDLPAGRGRGDTRATMPYIPNSVKFISAITNYHKTSQNLIYRKIENFIDKFHSTKNTTP